MSEVLVLNGPNLGRLGMRQPEIYGTTTYPELVALCEQWGEALGLRVVVRQSNHEGELLDWCMNTSDAEFRRRSPQALGFKGVVEKQCGQQLRRPFKI